MSNNHSKAIIISSLGVLLLSFESLLIKLANINAMTFSFYAGLFMFISINLILLKKHKYQVINTYKNNFYALLICGALFGISNIFFINAIKTTSVANTVMIFASAPLFSSLYSYVLYKENTSRNIYISSFFIFLGLFVIFSSQLEGGDLLGNFYALICVNLFALSFVILAKYKNANRFSITACAGLFSALISFLLADSLIINNSILIILFIAGFFVSPFSRVLMGIGTQTLPASEVSLLMIIETIMAPIWVWIFLNELPGEATFLGGSIILLTLTLNSIYLIKTSKQRKLV